MTPEASLAQAEAARRAQERKREAEGPVRSRLDQILEENHLAELFREALGRRALCARGSSWRISGTSGCWRAR